MTKLSEAKALADVLVARLRAEPDDEASWQLVSRTARQLSDLARDEATRLHNVEVLAADKARRLAEVEADRAHWAEENARLTEAATGHVFSPRLDANGTPLAFGICAHCDGYRRHHAPLPKHPVQLLVTHVPSSWSSGWDVHHCSICGQRAHSYRSGGKHLWRH